MNDFSQIPHHKILYKDKYFFIIKDEFPVSPGHLLIISNDIKKDFFDLNDSEQKHLFKVIKIAKELILENHKPNGFNIGMNCGEVAGQSIFHFHCHIIPRYKGDMENPRGGVRYVIPSKGNY